MMRNRGIKDSHVAHEIYEYIEELVGQDWRIDPASKQYFIFHFVSFYLFAHVPAGYFEEKEADRIIGLPEQEYELICITPWHSNRVDAMFVYKGYRWTLMDVIFAIGVTSGLAYFGFEHGPVGGRLLAGANFVGGTGWET